MDRFVLYGVSWELYDAFSRGLNERPTRLTYDEGTLEMSRPSLEHEDWKTLVGGLIEDLAIAADVSMRAVGSMTLLRRTLKKGVEPDESYYFKNEPKVRGKKRVDLRRDPPPDLVVEVDVTHYEVDREGIYAAMGVPELWRFRAGGLRAFRLVAGTWRATARSLSFPFLRPAQLDRFLQMAPSANHTVIRRVFRAWLDEMLGERAKGSRG